MSDSNLIPRHRLKYSVDCRAREIYPEDPDPIEGNDMRNTRYRERFPESSWLSLMIGFPQLNSDVLVMLDCFVEGLVGPDPPETIRFLLADDNSWARYLLLFAGYANPSAVPGRLSDRLMSLLEALATSKRFYAREGLITSQIIRHKLEKEVRFDDGLDLCWFGNDGKDFIHGKYGFGPKNGPERRLLAWNCKPGCSGSPSRYLGNLIRRMIEELSGPASPGLGSSILGLSSWGFNASKRRCLITIENIRLAGWQHSRRHLKRLNSRTLYYQIKLNRRL